MAAAAAAAAAVEVETAAAVNAGAKPEVGASAAAHANGDRKTKPEKPDEEKFREDLAQAEREHAAVMEQLVRIPCYFPGCTPLNSAWHMHISNY